MKKSAEAAAENGEILGEPYTPPGRTAVFDVPAYDDIADLHELFKRFANTAAGVNEAGLGGIVDKDASFTVGKADLSKTYVCTAAALMEITVGPASGFTEGDRFNVVQGGAGKVQVVGDDVIGSYATSGQYEGLSAVVHGGKWWCLPFGSSSGGGGGGGPLRILNYTADHTLTADDMGALAMVDASAASRTVTVPADDGSIPIGSVVVVSNTGTSTTNKVVLKGADGVTLQDRANQNIMRWKSVSLVKRAANTWLLNAGGGEGSGSAPAAPKNAQAFGIPAGLLITWETPADDGGSTIASYTVEYGESAGALTNKKLVDAADRSVALNNLAEGKTYYAWVKATNAIGTSDPSSVVSGQPKQGYNAAEGGDVVKQYVKDGRTYQYHMFTKSGSFNVTAAHAPFRVLVVGGGGGGGGSNNLQHGGGGGGGKAYSNDALTLAVKGYGVTVGPGGAGGPGNGAGVKGTASSFDSTHVADGGDGGSPNCSMCGGAGGASLSSDITGVVDTYGPNQPYHDAGPQRTFHGCGGRGGDAGTNSGNKAIDGVVIIAYEVAPWNDATGGDEIKDVVDYNGKTGETWRYHKFRTSGELIVKNASQPFRVLVVAGGGGGGGGGPYAGGGGGGGAGGLLFKEAQTLAAQTYTVTVGQGGAGGSGAISGQHNGVAGRQGGHSIFAGIDATGGGGGEAYQDGGTGGGSGGGSYNARTSNYPGIDGQGNMGGPGEPGPNAGAGGTGGGAGANGASGGTGKTINITGANVSYSHGGGCSDTGGDAAANTGNGGTGDRYGGPNKGGNGGSGVVIVAYRIK